VPVNQPLHILVVDDDGDVRDVLAAILEIRGYRVTAASGGASMRRILDAGGIDAVVLDALMPGEPSASLALRAKQLRLPVVMISGSDQALEIAQSHDLQLLEKPFRPAELAEALHRAFASGEFGQRGT
jgi:DNA-binding NtrC family response regulator